MVQPDIAVVCDQTGLDEKGCRGAPDFIIEIVSSGTAGRDQMETVTLYEAHGVREYWIIYPVEELTGHHSPSGPGIWPFQHSADSQSRRTGGGQCHSRP